MFNRLSIRHHRTPVNQFKRYYKTTVTQYQYHGLLFKK
ncbi:hypothetical protein AWV72_01645 [Lactiplantibacillus plantarum]|nr:hypothetical protein AWV72_01645 [Lactiplantibacillus plantarum]